VSDRIHIGTRKGLFTLERGAQGWGIADAEHLGDPVVIVSRDPRDDTLYAALDHGHFGPKMHRRPAAGGDWEEIAVPVYPEKPEGLEDKDGSGAEIPWTLKLIWALTPGHASQPGRLWCGTLPGGLFRSDDRGDSWQLVQSLWDHADRKEWFGGGANWPGIHSVLVHPTREQQVAVGLSCGGVWISEDDGGSWACRSQGMRAEFVPPERTMDPRIQDPHCVVQCPGSPEHWWTQHHNGIFRSVDGSQSWTEVEDVRPSAFGFPVAVHPSEPDTAWFVPGIKDEIRYPVDAQLVVTRTRDGGQSFDVLRDGLPQEHAYDVVLRHALDIDGSGDRLAFGSTTGNVYVTEDQGDHWECVSTSLPPVYCVRFGGS
jgi:hypothetical protein